MLHLPIRPDNSTRKNVRPLITAGINVFPQLFQVVHIKITQASAANKLITPTLFLSVPIKLLLPVAYKIT
ncbi:hypothetical protein BH09BAC6_BH09BAC6_07620 [soil metagenome]